MNYYASAALLLLGACASTPTPLERVTAAETSDSWRRQACAQLHAEDQLQHPEAQQVCVNLELQAARVAVLTGNLRTARERFETALRYGPSSREGHTGAAATILAQGDTDRGTLRLMAALTDDPGNASARQLLAHALIKSGHTDDAEKWIKRCAGEDDIACYCARGESAILASARDLPGGVRRDQLLTVCPQIRTPLVAQCEQLMEQNECGAAVNVCQQALDAWPQNVSARVAWHMARECAPAPRAEGTRVANYVP